MDSHLLDCVKLELSQPSLCVFINLSWTWNRPSPKRLQPLLDSLPHSTVDFDKVNLVLGLAASHVTNNRVDRSSPSSKRLFALDQAHHGELLLRVDGEANRQQDETGSAQNLASQSVHVGLARGAKQVQVGRQAEGTGQVHVAKEES